MFICVYCVREGQNGFSKGVFVIALALPDLLVDIYLLCMVWYKDMQTRSRNNHSLEVMGKMIEFNSGKGWQ